MPVASAGPSAAARPGGGPAPSPRPRKDRFQSERCDDGCGSQAGILWKWAYNAPPMNTASRTVMSLNATSRRETFTGMLLVSLLWPLGVRAQSPPPDLARRVAERATQARRARDQFTYRQKVVIEELSPPAHGPANTGRSATWFSRRSPNVASRWSEASSDLAAPATHRGGFPRHPRSAALPVRLRPALDLRNPLQGGGDHGRRRLLRHAGPPAPDPGGQRLFDGLVWAAKKDYSMVRSEGKAVPRCAA